MATKGALVSDIELRLTKGKPSDDLELERSQIEHWLDIIRDEIVEEFILRSNKNGDYISSEYITKEPCISYEVETDSCVTNSRKFITLSNKVLNLPSGAGVIKIYNSENSIVYPSTLEDIDIISDLPFSAPSDLMSVYHIEGPNKIVISGVNDNPVTAPSFTVFYIPQADSSGLGDDDNYPISNDLVGILLDRVEEIGRRQLYGSTEDLENDGQQDING